MNYKEKNAIINKAMIFEFLHMIIVFILICEADGFYVESVLGHLKRTRFLCCTSEKGINMDQNQNNQSIFDNQNSQSQQVNENENQNPEYLYQEYQAPVYANEFKPIKKKFNPIFIIIPAVIIVAAAIVFFILFFNQANYQKAERKYFNDMFAKALSSAETVENTENYKPKSVTVDVQTTLDRITSAVDISNINFKNASAIKDNNIYNLTEITVGEKNISVEAWMDNAEEIIYMYFPEISEIYGKVNLNDIINQFKTREEQTKKADYSELMRVFGDVISKTSDTYFEIIGDPEIIKNQDLFVGEKIYTVDKTVIHLNASQIATIVKALYNNFFDNEEAVKLSCDLYGFESEAEIRNALDEKYLIKELDKIIDGEEHASAIDMTVYMSKNNIIGRDIVITNDDLDQITISFYDMPTDNGNVKYFGIESSDSQKNVISFLSEDSVKDEAHTGKVVFTADDQELTLDYNDFVITDKLFRGEASLSIKSQPAFSVNLKLSSEGETRNAVLTVPNICTINVKIEPSTLEYKELPQLSDSNTAIIVGNNEFINTEANVKFYEDIKKFIYELMEIPDFDYNNPFIDDDFDVFPENIYDYDEDFFDLDLTKVS